MTHTLFIPPGMVFAKIARNGERFWTMVKVYNLETQKIMAIVDNNTIMNKAPTISKQAT